MGLETGTYIDDLVASNPDGGDQRLQGDNHIRLVKAVLQNTFPEAAQALYPQLSIATAPAELANNSVDPDHVIDIAAKKFLAEDDLDQIDLAATTIDIEDTGNGGRLDSETLDADTWYHVLAGKNTSDNAFVAGFKKTIVKPLAWDNFRRLGSVKTDGSSNIKQFTQFGDEFLWDLRFASVNTTAPGTAANLVTLETPLGVQTWAIITWLLHEDGATHVMVTALGQTDVVPTSNNHTLKAGPGGEVQNVITRTRTDVLSRIRYRSDRGTALTSLIGQVNGWIDPRGRDG